MEKYKDININFLYSLNHKNIFIFCNGSDKELLVEKIQYFQPELSLKFIGDVLAPDDLVFIYSSDLNFDLIELIDEVNKYLDNEILLVLPLGYPAFVAYEDLCRNASDSKKGFIELSTLLRYLINLENKKNINISINTTILKNYLSFSNDSAEIQISERFYQILQCKNKYFPIYKIDGDLPYFFNIHLAKDKVVNESKLKIPISKSVSKNSKIKIYSVFDKKIGHENFFQLLEPFFVSQLFSDDNLEFEKPVGFFETTNFRSSELTAIHYLLRMDKSTEVLGFCHYRRFINVTYPEAETDKVYKFNETQDILDQIESREFIFKHISECDVMLGSPLALGNSQHLQYCLSHYSDDYYLLANSVLNDHIELRESFLESMDSEFLYASNLIIGKREIVEYIFNTVFDVLELFKNIDNNNRTKYQRRDVAFLSERIFDTIIRYLIKNNIKVKFLPRIHLEY